MAVKMCVWLEDVRYCSVGQKQRFLTSVWRAQSDVAAGQIPNCAMLQSTARFEGTRKQTRTCTLASKIRVKLSLPSVSCECYWLVCRRHGWWMAPAPAVCCVATENHEAAAAVRRRPTLQLATLARHDQNESQGCMLDEKNNA